MELLLWRQDKASNWHLSAQATVAEALRLAPADEAARALAGRIESETAR
ncbi:MAG: hypothetical protein HYV15_05235 [Elusimicrobia bacterium]|nr:hypothetical protein [Elusimicrobiota bacterium]